MSSIEFAFENPWYLLLVIPSFAIILLPFLRLPAKRRKTFRKIAPVVLHLIVVTLLVLIIAGFTIVRNSDEQAVMLLVDLSDSTRPVQTAIEENAQQLLDLIDEETPVGVILFGQDRAYSVKLDEDRAFALSPIEADATDIDAALEYAANQLPKDKAGRIIVLSDGKQTDGDALNTAQVLATQGIRIDAVYFDTTDISGEEVQINSFTPPDGAYVGDTITFIADIQSNTDTQITLSLYGEDGALATVTETVKPGSNVFELSCVAERAGTQTYRLLLDAQQDTVTNNNESCAYVNVAGEPTVLIIADTIGNAEKLATLLEEENTVTTATARNAPNSIIELCDYDEVILSNVDYDQLPSGYDELLETYVSVFGRSLLTVGGTDTMMYGSMGGTALEEMLPVTLRLQENSEGKTVALMLVLDCSSSMSQQSTYLSVAKQGAIKCVEAMSSNDYVGVISFNSTAYLKSALIEATDENKEALTRTISALSTNRGTYYTEALILAHEELLESNADIRHIIFLSDGQPSDNGYTEAVRDAAEDGITVSTIGLGYSSDILESLASYGSGRYYYVSSALDLPDIMLSETEQVTVSSLITGQFVPVVAEDSALTATVSATALPQIYGYLGTTIKEEATAYITTEEGHPIYAAWTYGAGTVACFTCDLNGNWSSDWMTDPVGTAITQQMVATTVDAVHHDSSMSAMTTVRGQTTDITVATAGDTDNALTVTAISEEGTQTYLMTQSEPGIFTTRINTSDPGVYQLMVTQVDENGAIVDYLETAVAVSYSTEYDAFADSGETLLAALCDCSDGAVYTDLQQLASVRRNAIRMAYNPMVIFAVICAILLLADIAIRKLRWKDILNHFTRNPRK